MNHTDLSPRDQLAFTAGRAKQAAIGAINVAKIYRDTGYFLALIPAYLTHARKAQHDYLRAMREIERLDTGWPTIERITSRPVDAAAIIRRAVENLA